MHVNKEFTGKVSASHIEPAVELTVPSASLFSGSLIPNSPSSSLGSLETPWAEGYFSSQSIFVGGNKLVEFRDGDLILNPAGLNRIILHGTQISGSRGKFSEGLEVSEELHMTSGSVISGSLIPSVTDSPDHSLGKPDRPWKDAYLSSGSLFIDGVKTLHREGGVMKLGTGEDFEISGSLVGTASFAGTAETASLADKAATASVATTASFTETASLAETAVTASLASFAQAAPTTITIHSGIVDQILLDLFDTVEEIPDLLTFRFLIDLSQLRQARLVANVTLTDCGSGSFVALQFSTDGETTWNYLGGNEQPQLPCTNAGSVKSGLWADITGSAQQEVVVRLVGKDPTQTGNQSNTIEVGTFLVQFR